MIESARTEIVCSSNRRWTFLFSKDTAKQSYKKLFYNFCTAPPFVPGRLPGWGASSPIHAQWRVWTGRNATANPVRSNLTGAALSVPGEFKEILIAQRFIEVGKEFSSAWKNSFVTATWSHHHQQCSSVAFSCIAISCSNILPGAEIHPQHCKLQCQQ